LFSQAVAYRSVAIKAPLGTAVVQQLGGIMLLVMLLCLFLPTISACYNETEEAGNAYMAAPSTASGNVVPSTAGVDACSWE